MVLNVYPNPVSVFHVSLLSIMGNLKVHACLEERIGATRDHCPEVLSLKSEIGSLLTSK